MTRRTIHFSGRVQGVGFRYTAQNVAMRFAVTGYVRNLPDGRVELVVEGDEAEIDCLVRGIQEQLNGFIKKAASNSSPPTGEFSSFTIRH